MKPPFADEEIRPIAKKIWEDRVTYKIRGTEEGDWFLAELILAMCKKFKMKVEVYMKERSVFQELCIHYPKPGDDCVCYKGSDVSGGEACTKEDETKCMYAKEDKK